MNAFNEVIKFYKPIVKLTHKQQVCRLYRYALREAWNWSESRDLYYDEAEKIRERFDANKSLPQDSALVLTLIRKGYEELQENEHPDPYINPHMPGGSSFMRNPAVPLEVVYPSGIPEHYIRRQLNIDLSNVPLDQPYANKVFVDSVNKKYWIDK